MDATKEGRLHIIKGGGPLCFLEPEHVAELNEVVVAFCEDIGLKRMSKEEEDHKQQSNHTNNHSNNHNNDSDNSKSDHNDNDNDSSNNNNGHQPIITVNDQEKESNDSSNNTESLL